MKRLTASSINLERWPRGTARSSILSVCSDRVILSRRFIGNLTLYFFALRNERSTSIGSQSTGTGSDSSSRRSRAARPPASVALKRLVGHGPKNRFYRATRELGRVFKTEFILDYLSQPALRTRIRRGLLKGEQLHALARCVHYGRLGPTGSARLRTPNRRGELPASHPRSYHLLADSGDRSCFERGGLGCGRSQLRVTVPYQPDRVWDNVLLYGEYQLNRSLVRSERLSV